LRPSLLRHPSTRCRERLGVLQARGEKAYAVFVEGKHRRLDTLSQLLRSLSHKSVLDRGFVLVRDKDGRPLRYVAEAEAAAQVDLEFADGHVEAAIGDAAPAADPGPAAGSSARRASSSSRPTQAQQKVNDPQGQLF
jgi:exodeoxyribonuclease VII large subunit